VSGETTTRDPATASELLHTGYEQQETRTQWSDKPHLLRRIPWVRTRDAQGEWEKRHPGVGELDGHYRTALVNDLMRHNIPIQVRLDPDGLAKLYPELAESGELTIMGPNPMAWAMPKERLPDVPYTLTIEWRDFNAWFANDLNYRAAEDVALGASYQTMPYRKVIEEGGAPVWQREKVDHPATRLFHWRTVADMEAGELPSGLVVSPHTAAARRLLADEPPPPEMTDEPPEAGDEAPARGGRRR
jgi:hypothetical protein